MSLDFYRKYKSQIETLKTENLKNEIEFDYSDEKFVAPALLNPDGSMKLSLLFEGAKNFCAADKRYLLRQLESAREKFRLQVLAEILRKEEEERKRAEKEEDEREIKLAKARFKTINEKLDQREKQGKQAQITSQEREIAEFAEQQKQKAEFFLREKEKWERAERERLERLPDFETQFSFFPSSRSNRLAKISYRVQVETGELEMCTSAM